MPVDTQYAISETLFQENIEQDHYRSLQFAKAWEAYEGRLPKPLKVEGAFDDNVRINPAQGVVDAGVSFLFGDEQGIQWTYQGDDPTNPEAAPSWLTALRQAWKANKQDTLLMGVGINGGVCGHVFIKLLPRGAGRDGSFPQLVNLDPGNVHVDWNPNDCTQAWRYTITYTTVDETAEPKRALARQQVIDSVRDANDVIQSWTITTNEQDLTAGAQSPWLQVGPTVKWDYRWPPIADCQNLVVPNQYWGMADLEEPVVDVISSLQFMLSNLNKIIRIHANPKTHAKGLTPDLVSEIQISPDGVIALPDPEAELKNLEMHSDLSAAQGVYNGVRAAFDEMTQTPEIVRGQTNAASSQLSGVNLSILFAPLLKRTAKKRRTYGDMLLELSLRILELMSEDFMEAENLLQIQWPDVMPGSAFLQRQSLLVDKQLGASTDTLLAKLGYDPATEKGNNMADMESLGQLQANNVGTNMNRNPAGAGQGLGTEGAATQTS